MNKINQVQKKIYRVISKKNMNILKNLAFNSIENQYGSVENFLIKGIGLSKKDIKQLRKKLLN
jgi:protein tyrosine/serine phosphatase